MREIPQIIGAISLLFVIFAPAYVVDRVQERLRARREDSIHL